jgi:hypothetical protein
MHPARTTLTTTTNPLVLVLLTWTLLWGFGVAHLSSAYSPQRPSEAAAATQADAMWEARWSERFPGCVALALWPHDEQPVAVVTLARDGSVARLPPHGSAPMGARVVGACR